MRSPIIRIGALMDGGAPWVSAEIPGSGWHAVAIPYAWPTRAQLRLVAARAWRDAVTCAENPPAKLVAVVDGERVELVSGPMRSITAVTADELEGRAKPRGALRFVGVDRAPEIEIEGRYSEKVVARDLGVFLDPSAFDPKA